MGDFRKTINRDRTEPEGKGGESRAKASLSLSQCGFFSRNLNVAYKMIEEARDFALPKDGKIEIRTCGQGHYWSLTGRIRPRSLESVILDGNSAHDLLTDVRKFPKSQPDWYTFACRSSLSTWLSFAWIPRRRKKHVRLSSV